jgi:hypothetical protein
MNSIVIFDLKFTFRGYPEDQIVRKNRVVSVEKLARRISRSVMNVRIIGENGNVDVTGPFPPKRLSKNGECMI